MRGRKIDQMEIKEIKIEELKPYENNPRHNEAAVGPVANSIKEFGFKVPIIIDKDNVIIAGHTRLKAAKLLGLETVPCVIADDLTEEQAKAFRLADNKVSELAEWDFDDLEKELEELDAMDLDFEMSDFGFESSEIGGVLSK
jgi:site-specific DNA-methyltransferase (adenine-specific)